MGWLSLVTKVTPKILRGSGKATSTLWGAGKAVTGTGWKAINTVANNPKTTAIGIGAAYAGWYKLNNPEESLGTAVGKTARDSVDASGGFVHDAVNGFTGDNTVEKVKETTTNVLGDLKDTVSESKGVLGTLNDTLGGISSFLGNLFGGNGMNMFSNFFNNLGSGKVSGLSIGALIAAGYFIFGRSGLLGKIGGLMLAMMMIGNNSHQQTQAVAQAASQRQSEDQQRSMHR